MEFLTFLTSPLGIAITVVIAVVIAVVIIRKLHQILSHWLQSFFGRHTYVDENVNRRLNRFAWILTIFLPVCILISTVWMQAARGLCKIYGIKLGDWLSCVYLAACLLLLFFVWRLLAFFNRCYQMKPSNAQRPIRPIIKFLFAVLIIIGLVVLGSVTTKERPLIFLSTLGGAMALFIFAFQNLFSSLVINFQINAEKMFKVGDWVTIDDKAVDGVVESMSAQTIKIRNWDRTLAFVPVRMLQSDVLVNHQSMMELGARRIDHTILIDQRSICFLTADEVAGLKKLHLVTDEMLKKSDSFPETDDLTGIHCWTNLELFTLYAEDYLHRRPDIRHDLRCLVRAKKTTTQGLELELYCFISRTPLVEFAPIQRAILSHLLAVLPSFRLHIFQYSSDNYQEPGDVLGKIGSSSRS